MGEHKVNQDRAVEAEARRSLSNLKIQKNVSNVLGTILLPGLLALWLGFAGGEDASKWFEEVAVILLVLQLIFGFLVISEPTTALGEYFREKDMKREIAFGKKAVDSLERSVESVSGHTLIARAWSVIGHEHAALNVAELSESELREKISQVVEPIVSERSLLFGVGAGDGEKWNFAVYRYDDCTKELMPVWRDKSASHPADGIGRTWKNGEGHVGVAYTRNQTIYVADARKSETAELISAPNGKQKAYDDDVYVSLASIPIVLSEETKCHGILAATSDVVGRFNKVNSASLEHAAIVLANLLERAHSPHADSANES